MRSLAALVRDEAQAEHPTGVVIAAIAAGLMGVGLMHLADWLLTYEPGRSRGTR